MHDLCLCGARGEGVPCASQAPNAAGSLACLQAPLDTIAVLRRKPQSGPDGQPAAAGDTAAAWCREGGGGREEGTSLALRLAQAGLGGGAEGAWAQMILNEFFDQDPAWPDDEDDDEEEEGECNECLHPHSLSGGCRCRR